MNNNNLLQLTYISRISEHVSAAQIEQIHHQAQKNNARLHITGVLVLTKHYFMQLLEGDATAVQSQFAKIAKDPRHTDVRIVSEKSILTRQFPDWHMGLTRTLDHHEHADLAAVINLYGKQPHFSVQHADAISLLFRSL